MKGRWNRFVECIKIPIPHSFLHLHVPPLATVTPLGRPMQEGDILLGLAWLGLAAPSLPSMWPSLHGSRLLVSKRPTIWREFQRVLSHIPSHGFFHTHTRFIDVPHYFAYFVSPYFKEISFVIFNIVVFMRWINKLVKYCNLIFIWSDLRGWRSGLFTKAT